MIETIEIIVIHAAKLLYDPYSSLERKRIYTGVAKNTRVLVRILPKVYSKLVFNSNPGFFMISFVVWDVHISHTLSVFLCN